MNATEKIARFIVQTRLKDVPPPVVEEAKKAFLDCFGVTVAGSTEPAGRSIASFVREMGGKPEAAVLGCGFRTSALWASLANGVMSHAMDYDDGGGLHIALHPSVTVAPVALSLGEALGASGARVLEAYILGIEVECKIAQGISAEHMERGFHPTATLGPFGAATAAAKLLGLDEQATRYALGIVASTSSGLRQNFGTMTKPLHAGHACKDGVMAALLASKGWTAAPDVLEAPLGFYKVMAGDGFYDLAKAADHLGSPWQFIFPGIKAKIYPCCRGNHTSLDTIFQLLKRYPVRAEEVASVEVGADDNGAGLFYHDPKTTLEAKFSLEYNMAAALVDGQVGLHQFTEERLWDPQIRELLRKVRIFPHPKYEHTPDFVSEVTIKLKDGTTYNHLIHRKRSEVPAHMEWDELLVKFKDCATLALSPDVVGCLAATLPQIDSVDDIGTVMEMAMASASTPA
ncbi:MAG: MmgE/PrpD family protein [Chloroflexi bacterium]|nr:MmgE/PrpD family protein [Chloroflexota bacterium]